MQMTKRRPRPRTLISALAASGLLVGALLASGSAAAAPSHPAGAVRPTNGPPAGAPVTSPAPGQVFTPGSSIKLTAAPFDASLAAKDGLSASPVTAVKFY